MRKAIAFAEPPEAASVPDRPELGLRPHRPVWRVRGRGATSVEPWDARLAGLFGERLESGADEGDDRVDRGGDLVGGGRLREASVLSFEDFEGGGEGGGGDLRAKVAWSGAEVGRDGGGE